MQCCPEVLGDCVGGAGGAAARGACGGLRWWEESQLRACPEFAVAVRLLRRGLRRRCDGVGCADGNRRCLLPRGDGVGERWSDKHSKPLKGVR